MCLKFASWLVQQLSAEHSGQLAHQPPLATTSAATRHKLKLPFIAKDKEEAILVHDRGHHAPEDCAHLDNCFPPSSSLNVAVLNSSSWQHPESC